MHGEAESAATPEGDAFVVRIPVYRDSSVAEFPPKEVPERYLLLSAEEARGLKLHYARTINSERFCSIGSCCCGSRTEKL